MPDQKSGYDVYVCAGMSDSFCFSTSHLFWRLLKMYENKIIAKRDSPESES